MRSRRLIFWGVIGAVTSVALAACSGAGGGTSSGVLRVGYDFASQFTNTFDPAKSAGNCDQIVTAPIYDTLIHLSVGGQLEPGLATSWSIDGKTITIHLRSGVEFSNGEPFNAQAVANGLLHDKTNTTLSDLALINSINVVDPLTIRINYSDTQGIELLYGMTGIEGEIPAPGDYTKANSDPIGAGPFEFVSYQSGSELVLKANPNYWDKSAYHIPKLEFLEVGVGPQEATAVESGSVDMVPIQATSYPVLKNQSAYGIAIQPTSGYDEFQFRFTPPFNNLLVRQAVEYAIDRPADQQGREPRVGAGSQPATTFGLARIRALGGEPLSVRQGQGQGLARSRPATSWARDRPSTWSSRAEGSRRWTSRARSSRPS